MRQIVLLALTLAQPALANAAGIRELVVPSSASGSGFSAMMWTPCASTPDEPRPGEILKGVPNCPIVGTDLPLVLISHGLGGMTASHHDTAEFLADAGFVVVALNHPLDSGLDMSRSDDIASLVSRPADVTRLLDYVLGASPAAGHIDQRRIGFFGFSRGGYTGLVLAGGVPDFRHVMPQCPPGYLMCKQISDGAIPTLPSGEEPRFKAFVIADPLNLFPGKENLGKVSKPVQLWSSAEGGQGVTPQEVASIAANLPAKPDFHLVPNSAHFSFLLPCPPDMAREARSICVDPQGFDRAAFHSNFNRQVLAFFQAHLR